MKVEIRTFNYRNPTGEDVSPRLLVIETAHPHKFSGFTLENVDSSTEKLLCKIVEEAKTPNTAYISIVSKFPSLVKSYKEYRKRYTENVV